MIIAILKNTLIEFNGERTVRRALSFVRIFPCEV